jgi:4-aminobutyrate aminotransferase-like enzyme
MPEDFVRALKDICEEHGILYVDDEVQAGVGRTGTVWAIEHYDGVEPDLLVSGKSLGGGMPLAAVTGRAEVMDCVPPGGLGGTFGGHPLACAAACATLDGLDDAMLARANEVGERIRSRLVDMAGGIEQIGDVRGLGPMMAAELVEDRATQAPAADLARVTTAVARDKGLLLLFCGLYGNVIRVLVPFVVADEDLDRGLDLLEESLREAAAQT